MSVQSSVRAVQWCSRQSHDIYVCPKLSQGCLVVQQTIPRYLCLSKTQLGLSSGAVDNPMISMSVQSSVRAVQWCSRQSFDIYVCPKLSQGCPVVQQTIPRYLCLSKTQLGLSSGAVDNPMISMSVQSSVRAVQWCSRQSFDIYVCPKLSQGCPVVQQTIPRYLCLSKAQSGLSSGAVDNPTISMSVQSSVRAVQWCSRQSYDIYVCPKLSQGCPVVQQTILRYLCLSKAQPGLLSSGAVDNPTISMSVQSSVRAVQWCSRQSHDIYVCPKLSQGCPVVQQTIPRYLCLSKAQSGLSSGAVDNPTISMSVQSSARAVQWCSRQSHDIYVCPKPSQGCPVVQQTIPRYLCLSKAQSGLSSGAVDNPTISMSVQSSVRAVQWCSRQSFDIYVCPKLSQGCPVVQQTIPRYLCLSKAQSGLSSGVVDNHTISMSVQSSVRAAVQWCSRQSYDIYVCPKLSQGCPVVQQTILRYLSLSKAQPGLSSGAVDNPTISMPVQSSVRAAVQWCSRQSYDIYVCPKLSKGCPVVQQTIFRYLCLSKAQSGLSSGAVHNPSISMSVQSSVRAAVQWCSRQSYDIYVCPKLSQGCPVVQQTILRYLCLSKAQSGLSSGAVDNPTISMSVQSSVRAVQWCSRQSYDIYVCPKLSQGCPVVQQTILRYLCLSKAQSGLSSGAVDNHTISMSVQNSVRAVQWCSRQSYDIYVCPKLSQGCPVVQQTILRYLCLSKAQSGLLSSGAVDNPTISMSVQSSVWAVQWCSRQSYDIYACPKLSQGCPVVQQTILRYLCLSKAQSGLSSGAVDNPMIFMLVQSCSPPNLSLYLQLVLGGQEL